MFDSCCYYTCSQGDQDNADVTTDYVIPRGTTQRAGVDHKRMDLRYFWGSVSSST